MTQRKKKIPFDKSEWVVLEEHNELWLRGSLSRAWGRKHMEQQYGYKVCLASQEFIDKLKKDPSERNSINIDNDPTTS